MSPEKEFLAWRDARELLAIPLNDIAHRLTKYIEISRYCKISRGNFTFEEGGELRFEEVLIKGFVIPEIGSVGNRIWNVEITSYCNHPELKGIKASLATKISTVGIYHEESEEIHFNYEELMEYVQKHDIPTNERAISKLSTNDRNDLLQKEANRIAEKRIDDGEKVSVKVVAELLAESGKYTKKIASGKGEKLSATTIERLIKEEWKSN